MDKFFGNVKALWAKTNRFHRVLLILLLIELKLLPGGKTGFHCNDPTLSHPFTGDTINWKWLLAVCGLLPLAVILIVERKYHNTNSEQTNKRSLMWFREYLFSYILNLCVVQLIKTYVGSPRPHFFDTCMPEEATTCEGSEFVGSYTCTKKVWNEQSDRSFPSGHTSLAIHAGLFIAYYLHKRLKVDIRTLRLAQVIPMLLSICCALSRVMDRRHHWSDVIAGTGIAVSLTTYTIYLCKDFKYSISKTEKDSN